jgi:hypothetical protein
MSQFTSAPKASSVHHCITASTILQHGTGTNAVLRLAGGQLQTPAITTLADASVTISAAQLANGFLIAPTTGAHDYTFPAATDVIAQFATLGTALVAGDMFTVKFQNTGTHTATLLGSATITLAQVTALATHEGADLIFRVLAGGVTMTCYTVHGKV